MRTFCGRQGAARVGTTLLTVNEGMSRETRTFIWYFTKAMEYKTDVGLTLREEM